MLFDWGMVDNLGEELALESGDLVYRMHKASLDMIGAIPG